MTALVQVEVVEDLAEEGGVTSSELKDAGFDLSEEVRDSLLGDLGVLLLRNLPSRLHHAHEVLVRGGAHGQVSVVVNELLLSDYTVVIALSSIEVVKEVLEDLVSGLTAFKELRVHGHVVDANDVRNGDLARAILVEHSEGLHDHSLSSLSELVSVQSIRNDGYLHIKL